jgi:hydroxypyruvate isomerase
MTRRDVLQGLAAAGGSAVLAGAQEGKPFYRKGKIKQAVCPGVFGRAAAMEDRARHTARLGLYGIDLVGPKDWPILKKYRLIPTMCPGGGGIREGLNRVENHAAIETRVHELIDQCAAAGAPNIIGLTGERKGQAVETGIENCVTFCNKIKSHLEEKNITFCIEYLNSKVNHPDYDFDHMKYGVEVCKRVGSPRVKILYDMYHAQIMEGDIIRTLRDNIQYIGHFHTAGNPGRHEMDDTQEMNYGAIAKAIADAGFTGFVSHEYSPVRDPIQSLEETVKIFDVV